MRRRRRRRRGNWLLLRDAPEEQVEKAAGARVEGMHRLRRIETGQGNRARARRLLSVRVIFFRCRFAIPVSPVPRSFNHL